MWQNDFKVNWKLQKIQLLTSKHRHILNKIGFELNYQTESQTWLQIVKIQRYLNNQILITFIDNCGLIISPQKSSNSFFFKVHFFLRAKDTITVTANIVLICFPTWQCNEILKFLIKKDMRNCSIKLEYRKCQHL